VRRPGIRPAPIFSASRRDRADGRPSLALSERESSLGSFLPAREHRRRRKVRVFPRRRDRGARGILGRARGHRYPLEHRGGRKVLGLVLTDHGVPVVPRGGWQTGISLAEQSPSMEEWCLVSSGLTGIPLVRAVCSGRICVEAGAADGQSPSPSPGKNGLVFSFRRNPGAAPSSLRSAGKTSPTNAGGPHAFKYG